MKILIVDDEEMIRNVLREYVEFEGNEADEAADGMEAVKKCRENDYDLILMNIQMPHMNGYEATKNIRGLPDGRCRIPIIAMTANAFEEDRKRAIESGMNGYVTKPIKIEELISTIKKILKS